MSIGEAGRLVTHLLKDSSTATAAAVAGWNYPMSREALILADLYDVTVFIASDPKKRSQIKPYPRPWPDVRIERLGSADHLSVEQFADVMKSTFGYEIAVN